MLSMSISVLLASCLQPLPAGDPGSSGIRGATESEARTTDTDPPATALPDRDTQSAPPLSPGDTTDATSPPGRPDTQTTEQQGDDSEGSDKEQDATAGDSGEVTSSTALFTLSVPVDAPVGRPVPLLVSGPKTWSGPLTLMIAGEPRTLGVYRGRGSLALTLGTEETIAISESDGDAETIDVVVSSRSERLLTGSLQGEDLSWGDEADIFLEGVVKVSAGLELSIGPGTRIFMGKDAHLEIAGSLNAVGPVLFTRASEEAWGGLVIGPGGNATLQDAWFVGGGGDDSKAFGHSASQPVVKEGLDRLRQGVEIELEVDGRVDLFTTQPAGVEEVDACDYVVTVAEGKKRQIRRMFTAIGHEVIALERISIGALSLDNLDLDYGEFIDISDLNLDALIQG